MNRLLLLTSALEAATGSALIAVPQAVVRLLLGSAVSGASLPLGRVGGIGLLSLAIACWPSRDSVGNEAGAFRAMLAYNLLATSYLTFLGIRGEWVGPLLWPAVALHGILSLLLARSSRGGSGSGARVAAR